MSLAALKLRLATLDELPLAREIDDAAGRLFVEAGLDLDLAEDHPFAVEERARWRAAAEKGGLYWAVVSERPVGFVAVGELDGHAYIEQLSVRPEYGRRGIGRALLEHAAAHTRARGPRELWLTTYRHLLFNGPFYERAGFAVVPEHAWGRGIRQVIDAQRLALPHPEQRIAMRRVLES